MALLTYVQRMVELNPSPMDGTEVSPDAGHYDWTSASPGIDAYKGLSRLDGGGTPQTTTPMDLR